MALRRASTDKRPDGSDAPGASAEKMGESVEECVALGQALVEAGQLPGEMLAASLADGDSDLWEYGVGRIEYAKALGKATGLPVADTHGSSINTDLSVEVEERIARKYKFV